jgi:hypothetical protein
MAQQTINVGTTANDGNGDALRNAFIKTNDNFTDLYANKQATLVSGTNIKTVNSTSLLGSGNVAVQATLVSGTNIKTIEGQSLLGSGNIDLTKSDVGLGNVDNTSDANKPVSTAQNTAINAKVTDAIVNGVTTVAPSQNAVFDALALKQDVLTNPITGTGTVNKLSKFSTTSEISPSLVYDDAVTVAVGTGTPEPSAILEVFSNSQGFLLPRMTNSEMYGVASPAVGLMIFNTDNEKIHVYTSSGWLPIPF